ncbi:hypothetical protein [Burkholderia metallica]|uniref:hypothetical protein n=1 Tax=Burkholderia metallica TaxID=488729 RepID=UPI001CF548D8|nr:hypothetical protein [Burkholderia metallica]MCA8023569.1 hypothetical protein [Burkholderia metallica]
MSSSITRPSSPAPTAPLETPPPDTQATTSNEPRPPSPRATEHIPLSSRRASTESTRAPLQVKASASRSAASTSTPAPARQSAHDEIHVASHAVRSAIFAEIDFDESAPQIRPFPDLSASALTPSEGPSNEPASEPTALAGKKGKEIETMLSMPPAQLFEQIQTTLEAAFPEIEKPGDSPVTPEDAKRANKELTTYIETGALTEEALVKPSKLGRLGAPEAEAEAGVAKRLSDDIQRTAQTLLPFPATATPEQRSSAVSLVAAQRVGIPGAEQMLASASIIAEHERSLHSTGTTDTPGAFRKLMKALSGGMSALTSNEFKSGTAAFGASLLNVGMRNGASVAVPTFARQLLSAQIERGLTKSGISDARRASLGVSCTALPMLLLAFGTIRAHMNPRATQAEKTEGDFARGIMAATSFSALLVGIFSGQFGSKTSGAAAQMIAFTLYSFMRDIAVQSHVRLKNPNMEQRTPGAKPVPDKLHWLLISLIYGVDQFGVNLSMPMAAPISGPGAYHAHLGAVDQLKGAGLRALINWGGEIIEDMSFNGIAAVRDKTALRLGLKWEPKPGNVVNGLLAPMAVRTAITQTNVVLGDLIDKPLGDNHPLLSNLLLASMGGVLNCFLYWPCANAGKGAPPANPQPQVTETVLSNVDLDDSRSVRSLQRQSIVSDPLSASTRRRSERGA